MGKSFKHSIKEDKEMVNKHLRRFAELLVLRSIDPGLKFLLYFKSGFLGGSSCWLKYMDPATRVRTGFSFRLFVWTCPGLSRARLGMNQWMESLSSLLLPFK